MGELVPYTPKDPRIDVSLWARSLTIELLHGPVWIDVNKRESSHEITMAARVLSRSKIQNPAERERFLDGVAFALGAQAYREDAAIVLDIMDRPLFQIDELASAEAVAEVLPISPDSSDAA